jgi:hypothetical protein
VRLASALTAALLAAATGTAGAQKQCRKGIPCGNTCIAATKTCHVVTYSAPSPPAPRAAQPAPGLGVASAPSGALGAWVGSRRRKIYYRRGCVVEDRLADLDRRYFMAEAEARDAGSRRSKVTGC